MVLPWQILCAREASGWRYLRSRINENNILFMTEMWRRACIYHESMVHHTQLFNIHRRMLEWSGVLVFYTKLLRTSRRNILYFSISDFIRLKINYLREYEMKFGSSGTCHVIVLRAVNRRIAFSSTFSSLTCLLANSKKRNVLEIFEVNLHISLSISNVLANYQRSTMHDISRIILCVHDCSLDARQSEISRARVAFLNQIWMIYIEYLMRASTSDDYMEMCYTLFFQPVHVRCNTARVTIYSAVISSE